MNNFIRILGIDPGCSHVGTSIIELYPDESFNINYVETIHTDKLLYKYKDVEFVHGTRAAKIHAAVEQISKLITMYDISYVVSEAPFYNPRTPNAYGSLVEVVSSFRTAISDRFYSIRFETIPPSNIKNAIGVGGGSKDKTEMKRALLNLNLLYDTYLDPSGFDEHSVDSIAVGICFCKRINSGY